MVSFRVIGVVVALGLAASGFAIVVLSRHREPPRAVRAVALSADSRWLASGSADGIVRVFDLRDRAVPARALEFPGNLNDLRFSSDSDSLAVANRNISIVAITGGGGVRVLRDDEANYGAVRFSPDGRSMLTINGKGAVQIIDRATASVRTVYCCSSIWGDVDFSADGKRIVWAGHWPGVWDLRSASLVGRLTASREEMTFGPVGMDDAIYMGSQDGRVHRWDLATRRAMGKSPPLVGYVRSLALLGASGWVAYAATGGPVHVWNPATGEARVVGAARATSNLVFDGFGNRVAFGTAAGNVEFWDLVQGRLLAMVPGYWQDGVGRTVQSTP